MSINQPAVYKHAIMIYDELFKNSNLVPIEDIVSYGYPSTSDTKEVTMFSGTITTTASQLGLSASQRYNATSLLYAMQAMTVLRRTNPRLDGLWILHYRPTDEDYDKFKVHLNKENRRIVPSKYDTMVDDLSDARVRIKELERQVKYLDNNLTYLDKVVTELQESRENGGVSA